MFSRQRAILRLIENEGGTASRLRLVKLAFLLSRETGAPRAGIYDFVPYKRGPFSFTLYHEMRALERDGWLAEAEHDIRIAEAPDLETAYLDRDFLALIDGVSSRHRSLTTSAMVLSELRSIEQFAYGCGAIAAAFTPKGKIIAERKLPDGGKEMPLVKIHGSVNWLYCDNCRQLYWFSPDQAISVAMQLLTRKEGKRLKLTEIEDCARWQCLNCTTVPLTTRIATFSFLKALDFPMFERSWLSAEQLLQTANKWIFIGYSLPAADYEFKHLLKRVQLSRMEPPEFVVITGGTKDDAEYTYGNYQRFFGRGIKKGTNFFPHGLSDAAIKAAHS